MIRRLIFIHVRLKHGLKLIEMIIFMHVMTKKDDLIMFMTSF